MTIAADLVRDRELADTLQHAAELAARHAKLVDVQIMAARAAGGDTADLERERKMAGGQAAAWAMAAQALRRAVELNRETYEWLTGRSPRPDLRVV